MPGKQFDDNKPARYPAQHTLMDWLLKRGNLKNDAALGKVLKIAAPIISKVRHGRLAVSPKVILAVHEHMGVPVAEIRKHIWKG